MNPLLNATRKISSSNPVYYIADPSPEEKLRNRTIRHTATKKSLTHSHGGYSRFSLNFLTTQCGIICRYRSRYRKKSEDDTFSDKEARAAPAGFPWLDYVPFKIPGEATFGRAFVMQIAPARVVIRNPTMPPLMRTERAKRDVVLCVDSAVRHRRIKGPRLASFFIRSLSAMHVSLDFIIYPAERGVRLNFRLAVSRVSDGAESGSLAGCYVFSRECLCLFGFIDVDLLRCKFLLRF